VLAGVDGVPGRPAAGRRRQPLTDPAGFLEHSPKRRFVDGSQGVLPAEPLRCIGLGRIASDLFGILGDGEEAKIEVEMRRLLPSSWDWMDVEIERARGVRMEPQLAAGFLARLSKGGRCERAAVRLLDMSARLQPAPQFRVVHQADALARRIDHHRACCEVRSRLEPGERILERLGKLLHLKEILFLLAILRLECLKQAKQLFSSALQFFPYRRDAAVDYTESVSSEH